MAQASELFAAAKVRMRQKKMIGKAEISRLLDADNFQAAKQVLVDIGFMPSVNDDYEQYADKYVKDACTLLSSCSPDENLSDALLYSYDAHNLKVLFKARLLDIEPKYLYTSGTVDLNKLKHSVINHNYSVLKEKLAECMKELENLSVTGIEPYLIDAKIDKSCYELIFDTIKNTKYDKLKEYFSKKITFLNIIMTLRLLSMNKSTEILKTVLLDNSLISKKDIINNIANIQKLSSKLHRIDRDFSEAFTKYTNAQMSLSELEKVADNSLLKIFKDTYYKFLDVNYLVAFIISTQRQASALRLVMAGKASGASNDAIRERMREIYAK